MSQDGAYKDHSEMMDEEEPRRFEENVRSKTTWLRLFFMLVVLLLWGVSRIVIGTIVFIQFFWLLFAGETNQQLRHAGEQLARYSYQIIRYLTFNSEDRPFPFDLEWPSTRTAERGREEP